MAFTRITEYPRHAYERQTIAVISDVHANAAAMREALGLLRRDAIKTLVCLGDLLTYGCQPVETLELIAEASSRLNVHLIKGNHDQVYFDIQQGERGLLNRFPDFIRESFEWTLEKISLENFAGFRWMDSFRLADIFFSHANPFGYGDWTYLDNGDDFLRAGGYLRQKACTLGVFGHTHRSQLVAVDEAVGTVAYRDYLLPHFIRKDSRQTYIANPGSAGQPRGTPPSMMYIDLQEQGVMVSVKKLSYSITEYRSAIKQSCLSKETQEKLLSYFNQE